MDRAKIEAQLKEAETRANDVAGALNNLNAEIDQAKAALNQLIGKAEALRGVLADMDADGRA